MQVYLADGFYRHQGGGSKAMKISIDSESEVIELDGVRISLSLLFTLAHPAPGHYYKIVRNGDVVTTQEYPAGEGLRKAAV